VRCCDHGGALLFGIELLAVSVIPVVGPWYVLRRLAEVSQGRSDLDELLGFTTTIGRSLDPAVVARTGLDEAMRLIRARIGKIEGFLGLLVVSGRLAGFPRFDSDDVARTAMIASYLAMALRKARLHGAMGHAATHDDLTGPLDRAAFEAAVDAALAEPYHLDRPAVLMLDLDNFKDINDTLGHHVGDEVLLRFAERVSDVLGSGDAFARFNGDEFAVLLRRPTFTDIRFVANEILSVSYAPLKLADLDVVRDGQRRCGRSDRRRSRVAVGAATRRHRSVRSEASACRD